MWLRTGIRISYLALMLSCLLGPEAEARTWHISTDHSGDAPTIQAGIDSARANDDVLLAPGTYTWASEGVHARSMLTLKPGIWLHSESGAASTILDAENKGRLLRVSNPGDQTRIEGLTVTRGLVTYLDPDVKGGGIFCSGIGHPIIDGCVLTANEVQTRDSAGGGICATTPDITIRNCVIQRNRTGSFGGGIWCGLGTIEDCQILDNYARALPGSAIGGGIYCGAAHISRCLFRGNYCTGDPAASRGALSSAGATVQDCTFTGNQSAAVGDNGGATFERCKFLKNLYSGTLAVGDGSTVSDCLFAGNTNLNPAGGAAIGCGSVTIRRCVFLGNRLSTTSTAASSGAIYAVRPVQIEACTFVGNILAGPVGAANLLLKAGGTVTACLVVASVGPVCYGPGTWSCCDFYGNASGNDLCGTDAGHNFSADPLFCDADPTTSQSVLLQQNSPCAPGHHPLGAESCDLIGAGQVGCSTTAAARSSWTEIKAMYR